MVRLTDHLDMTIAVDRDVKPRTKQNYAETLVNAFKWAISSVRLGERRSYLTRPRGYKTFFILNSA